MKRALSLGLILVLVDGFVTLLAGRAFAACHFAGFSSNNYQVKENAGSVTITVNRPNSACIPAQSGSVKYSTSDGTAQAGADYEAASDTLTFAAGDSSKTFMVRIIDDKLFKGDRTFTVSLSNPSGPITTVGGPATVTIQEDDPSPAPPPAGTSPKPTATATTASPTATPTATTTPGSPLPLEEASPEESPTVAVDDKTAEEDGAPTGLIVAAIAFVLAAGAGVGLWFLRRTPAG